MESDLNLARARAFAARPPLPKRPFLYLNPMLFGSDRLSGTLRYAIASFFTDRKPRSRRPIKGAYAYSTRPGVKNHDDGLAKRFQ